ncbi:MAG: MotA/TolQ/ExbB proton channel family protein [Armatimonadota bacterium]
MSLWQQIQQGAIALVPLAFCSVLVVAVVLDRMWTFARLGKIPQELIRRVESLISTGKWHDAVRLLDESNTPYARIAKASLMRKNASDQEITDILTLACDAELATAAKPVPILGTIGNIAPFIGLFGTVIGIMKAFEQIALKHTAGAEAVSAGIAEALIATAAGLGVGIVAVVCNNWCNTWLERYRLDLERFSTEWGYTLQNLRESKEAVLEPVE